MRLACEPLVVFAFEPHMNSAVLVMLVLVLTLEEKLVIMFNLSKSRVEQSCCIFFTFDIYSSWCSFKSIFSLTDEWGYRSELPIIIYNFIILICAFCNWIFLGKPIFYIYIIILEHKYSHQIFLYNYRLIKDFQSRYIEVVEKSNF